MQKQIELLGQRLENWYQNLPTVYDFKPRQMGKDFYVVRLELGFFIMVRRLWSVVYVFTARVLRYHISYLFPSSGGTDVP
jgi:hypothetical protein